ncbi:aspartyl-phosphate phosphatase Spo0E family protein [Paenibacillus sp. OV219]|uniref:aspartyl-phosphate phosphatase Spo0E family protein n=1 Tax=Paenibacillus sp. OV219 TaxID=1884377 RepID=UPI0008C29B5A|nr:aspartyl-phosphate phosphatase Spo0E family protein [Paenibacillus sp. OV219]SEN22382.1 Spo0E like sporulation regulatory protein [Paenibacillus sp. OV219]
MENHNQRLERLRNKLIAAALDKETFLHPEVILLSQALDQMIVKEQREKYKRVASQR